MPHDKSLLHNEIRDKVISQLLDKICTQHKEIIKLNEENRALRTNLTDMYKKMILFKSTSLSTMKKNGNFSFAKSSSGSSPFLIYNNCNRPLLNKLSSIKVFSPPRSSYMNNNQKIISRNKHSNDTLYSSQESSVYNSQSLLLSTNDKVSTSKLLSNTSSNGYLMTVSPRRKGQKISFQKTYRSTKISFLTTQTNLNPKGSNKKKAYKKIENFHSNNTKKNKIKVSVNNTYKWDPLA